MSVPGSWASKMRSPEESKDQLSDDVSKVIAYLKRLVTAGVGGHRMGKLGERAAELFRNHLILNLFIS